jgi:MFS family permease
VCANNAAAVNAAAAAPAVARPVAGHRVGVIFSGLMLVMLPAALDSTIVATALPTIVGDLGGLERLSWVTSAYLLAQTAVTPLYGKLGDQLGRKRVLQSAVVLFLVGSALCGLAGSMTMLIAFRAVQGLGAGGLIDAQRLPEVRQLLEQLCVELTGELRDAAEPAAS